MITEETYQFNDFRLKKPRNGYRFIVSFLDFTMSLLLGLFSFFGLNSLSTKYIPKVAEASISFNKEIIDSNLCNADDFTLFDSKSYFSTNESNKYSSFFIYNQITSFYIDYMNYSFSDYNLDVLNIENNNYFIVSNMNEFNEINTNKLNDYKLIEFFDNLYRDSIDLFYSQTKVKNLENITNTNSSICFASGFIFCYLLIHLIIPLTNKYHYTIGRRIFKFVCVDNCGYLITYKNLLVKPIPFILVIISIALLPNIPMTIFISLFSIAFTSLMMCFTQYKQCLSDKLAKMILVKGENEMLFKNHNDYVKYLEVVNNNGK